MSEWPLIAYTLLLQFACGLTLSLTLLDLSARGPDEKPGLQPLRNERVMRSWGLAVGPLALSSLAISMFHLGRPLSAFRSLSNIGSSWVSREVLASLMFAAASCLYGWLWWRNQRRLRAASGAASSLLGLAAVGAGAALYMVPARPAWDSGWLPLSFFGTTLLLGGAAPALLAGRDRRRCPRTLLVMIALGGLSLAAAALWMVAGLASGHADSFIAERMTGGLRLLTSDYAVWLGLYVLMGAILPLVVASRLWPYEGTADTTGTGIRPKRRAGYGVIMLAVIAGTLIGRILMFVLGSVTAIP